MFDQSFSAKNFRKLFDFENRKGVFLEGRFFPQLEPYTKALKEQAKIIRAFHKKAKDPLTRESYDEDRRALYHTRQELKEKKEALLMQLLEDVCDKVAQKDFDLRLEVGQPIKGMHVYTAGSSAASYFALKQVQYNLRRLYKVQQSNRHHIVCQLRELLKDRFPKYIVRTDVSQFYESIPRDQLLKRLADDPLLTLTTRHFIRRLLWDYGKKSGASKGVPRGIGISAYLSELHMRPFDEMIRSHPHLLYYARYVDDIFIIVVPQPNQDRGLIQADLDITLSNAALDRGLTLNTTKTQKLFADGNTQHEIDFLGYRFTFGQGKIDLRLTDSKVHKFKKRIDASFAAFIRHSAYNEHRARRLLYMRLKFLTGNTRLANNKKKAVVGSYFSHSHISTSLHLNVLDVHLSSHVTSLPHSTFKTRLSRLSFVRGFNTRRFHSFSSKELSRIVRAWKHAS